jgi:hypothetical protein
VETDAALCYFLMKNEPYVKAQKDKFLRALGRGDDILDGAGAALQGKERDYIFYLWDVTRYNMRSFKQGDEADQRKGELNVLMSRPKKKAFHFLHREFEELEHGRSNITDFLWRAHGASQRPLHETVAEEGAVESTLLGRLLNLTIGDADDRALSNLRRAMKRRRLTFRENIQVGDARRVVDLIGFRKGRSDRVVGLVDLSAFGATQGIDEAIIDYFFQLKRVSPGVDPVFVFPHELVDEHCPAFRSVTDRLERALD